VIATSAAIAPLPTVPTSSDRVSAVAGQRGADHAGGGRQVRHDDDLGEAVPARAQRRARVEAEPPEPQDQHAEPEERHRVPGDRARPPVGAVLALARAQQQQRRQAAGGAGQVHDGRAGEVLHPRAELVQQSAAEDPVRDQRVDDAREDHAVDRIGDEADALQRRAPHDRQRHRAEHHLEEEVAGARAIQRSGDRAAGMQDAAVAEEEAGVARERRPTAEGQREARHPPRQGRDREVQQHLGDDRPGVLAAREADLHAREARLHEHHQHAGDDHPPRVELGGELLQRAVHRGTRVESRSSVAGTGRPRR
jgi:hypothetical protein